VPSKVWKGLPQPTDDASADFEPYSIALTRMGDTVLSGFAELSKADQRAFIEHVRNKDANWTKEIKRKAIKAEEPPPAPVPLAFQDEDYQKMKQEQKAKAAAAKEEAAAPVSSSNDAIVVQSNAVTASAKQAFIIPKPGVNGASSETALKGKTFVLSGTFPEVGGGSGLSLGKAKAKAMIQSFGGRVTGSISGVTDVLVVGKNPGMVRKPKYYFVDYYFLDISIHTADFVCLLSTVPLPEQGEQCS
jgi:NAD-dependent DNA ligase